jgi:mRNA interferase RelE/StbE
MPEAGPTWTVVVHREAKRELHRLPGHILENALSSIRALGYDPYPTGCTKLRGCARLCRVRIGDRRIVYEVDDTTRTVTILRVASRGEVYRDL